jgi:Family of unknown function (DUF5681)
MPKGWRKRPLTTRPKQLGNYEVGYGRPPKATQWKKGQSGNRKGRPKGAKNFNSILHNTLTRPIKVREGGKIRTVSFLEAMILKFSEDAMKGDPKAATFLLSRYDPEAIRHQEIRHNRKDTKDMSAEELSTLYQRMMRSTSA